MKEINYAVCDDDEIVCNAICMRVYQIFKKCGVESRGTTFFSSVKLYNSITEGNNAKKFKLIFLDIDMPKLDGIQLGKVIRKNLPEADIIFVSNREEKVFDSILNVCPFGFVRKNNFSSDLSDTLRGYIVSKIDTENYLVVSTDHNSVTRSLRVMDIVYIEALRDHQYIYMANGDKVDVRMTMGELEEKLLPYNIVRTQKGYLVNYKYVRRIDRSDITLMDGTRICISRNKVQDIKTQYLKYLRRTGAIVINNDSQNSD